MLIYNVTTQITWSIHEEWVKWTKEIYITQAMSSGCFVDYRFVRVLEVDETEGPMYAIQFHAQDKTQYENFIEMHANALSEAARVKWGDRYFSFRSLMEVVN